MSLLKDIWSDLVEKKLWLIALPLLLAVVAVPTVLSKPGDVEPIVPAPSAGQTADTGPALTLTRAENTGFAMAPHVNTKRLDPFGDRTDAKANAIVKSFNNSLNNVITSGGGTATTAPTPSGGSGVTPVPSGGGGGGGGGGDTPPKTTPPATEQDDVISILVQDSTDTEGPTELDDVRTLSPLVDPDNPFLVYVGKAGTDSASFLVSSNVTLASTTQGTCAPSVTDCRTLTLKVGETATFSVPPPATDATTPVAPATVQVTLIDVSSKKVPVAGDEDLATAARAEHKARVVGARTLKRALKDPEIVKSLVKHHIRLH